MKYIPVDFHFNSGDFRAWISVLEAGIDAYQGKPSFISRKNRNAFSGELVSFSIGNAICNVSTNGVDLFSDGIIYNGESLRFSHLVADWNTFVFSFFILRTDGTVGTSFLNYSSTLSSLDSGGTLINTENNSSWYYNAAAVSNNPDNSNVFNDDNTYTNDTVGSYLAQFIRDTPMVEYFVKVNSTTNGSIVISKQTASDGDTVQFTAYPSNGYKLQSVSVMQGEDPITLTRTDTDTYTFTMPDGNVTINAIFVKVYNVTIDTSGAGRVTVDKTSAVPGEPVTLTVDPPTGYTLDTLNISSDGADVDYTRTGLDTYTFSMPDGDVSVDVTFKWIEQLSGIGTIIVLVNYRDEMNRTFQTHFDVQVREPIVLQNLQVVSYPNKISYAKGETIDYTGLTVVGQYSNGTERDITADCTFEPPQGYLVQSAGAIIVELFYKGELWQQFEMTATGESVIAGGDWWTLYDTGLLRIYCKGDMPSTPWNIDEDEYRDLITSVEMSDGVTSIGDFAFFRCSRLTSATIPDSVTSIGDFAFAYSSLRSVTIPDSVTSIGDFAFRECGALTSIIIPDSVTSIGNGVFVYCNRLRSVTIPDGVTSIGDDTFYGCTALTSVTIPDGVTSIGDDTFYGCTALTSVTIPDSVTSIRYYAFHNCHNLNDIYYSGTQAQWEAISIAGNNEALANAAIHYNSTGLS